jgi:nitrite reductase (NO-forming)
MRTPHETERSAPRIRSGRGLTALAAAGLLLGACEQAVEDAPERADGEQDVDEDADVVASVEITDNDYDPADVEVAAGETVEWENAGEQPHTVTFDDEIDSLEIDPGETWARTFDETGELAYYCTIHPDEMEGTVTVEE